MKVHNPDALQYMWYVEDNEPPEPIWELDMAVEVEMVEHGDVCYTSTRFYSKSKPKTEWIKSGNAVNLTGMR